MEKLIAKVVSGIIFSMVLSGSLFGQEVTKWGEMNCKPDCNPPCPQPCPPTQVCPQPCDPCCPPWATPVLNAAYNYPGRTMTRCPWDVFFDASFIYWQPNQDNMWLGFANANGPTLGGSFSVYNVNPITLDFDFKPGFKLGVGYNTDYDSWDCHAEYTWFHNQQNTSSNSPAGGVIFPYWGNPNILPAQVYNTASEKWHLKMDLLDVDLGRWHYVGTKLVVRPNFGARAAWIRQKLNVNYTAAGTNGVAGSFPDTCVIRQSTVSWAIGPKVGLDGNWMIGKGFRFFGNTEADLLFTRYTRINNHETHTAFAGSNFQFKGKHIDTMRSHFDLELGVGYGMYWQCNKWYTDLALGYEFQVFMDQNMFGYQGTKGDIFPNGNLYVQGLTAQFRFDF